MEHGCSYVWLDLTTVLRGLFLFIVLRNGGTETRSTWNSGAEKPSPSGLLSCEQGFEQGLAQNDDDDPDKKQGTVNRLWNVLCEGKTSGIPSHVPEHKYIHRGKQTRSQGVHSCDPTGITEIWCLLINSGTPAPVPTFIKIINQTC